MSFYDINWDLLVKRMLPTSKRSTWHLEWLDSVLNGVIVLYNDFQTFKSSTLTELSYNSQKLLFEKALNDNFDATEKRIYIDNSADDLEDSFCYAISEGEEDAYCYKLTEEPFSGRYTYRIFEYVNPLDFTVFVPLALTSLTENIKALVNFYKLAGKRYIIEYF